MREVVSKTVAGVQPHKLVMMSVLCLQNAGYTLLRRYSVGVMKDSFSPASVLLGGEVIKLLVSALQISRQVGHAGLLRRSRVMFVPALVFWAQNLLSYVSLQRVDATVFTVCAQLKILSTALAGVLMLGRKLSFRRWRALLLLVLAAIDVSFHSLPPDARRAKLSTHLDFAIGVAAVLVEVSLSGFINVYFERVLKTPEDGIELSIWDRNFQLAVWSIILYTPMALNDAPPGESILYGWTWRTVVLAALGAAGGILVALVTKHMDALMKTFAAAGGIVVTAVVQIAMMGQPASVGVGVGCTSAILALFNYLDVDEQPPRLPSPTKL